ncbi:hypothetical protein SLE2022_071360 [Rubroshorea leprosula]
MGNPSSPINHFGNSPNRDQDLGNFTKADGMIQNLEEKQLAGLIDNKYLSISAYGQTLVYYFNCTITEWYSSNNFITENMKKEYLTWNPTAPFNFL